MPALAEHPPDASTFPRTFSALPQHRRPDRPAPRPVFANYFSASSDDSTFSTRSSPFLRRSASFGFSPSTSPSSSTVTRAATMYSASNPSPSTPQRTESINDDTSANSTNEDLTPLTHSGDAADTSTKASLDRRAVAESSGLRTSSLSPRQANAPPRRADSPRPNSRRQRALRRLEQMQIWAIVAHDVRDDDDDTDNVGENVLAHSVSMRGGEGEDARMSSTASGSDESNNRIERLSSSPWLGIPWRRRRSKATVSLARRASVVLEREKGEMKGDQYGIGNGAGTMTHGGRSRLRRRRSIFRRIREGDDEIANDRGTDKGENEKERLERELKEMDDILGQLGAKRVEEESPF